MAAASASAGPSHSASAAAPSRSASGDATLRQVLRRLTTDDGAPGALVRVADRNGSTVLTSGVANLSTGTPVARDSRWRIGSATKTYVATVVLQLVAEHRVELDAPVERYLPGVVRGNGNDGHHITVRELLQHTSGLPDILTYLPPQDILAHRYDHHDVTDLVNIALAHPPLFAPGTSWSYSNTNYLLAGMLIAKVTGHPYGEEIRRRILKPLGLHATYVPGDRTEIPGPHPLGYVRPGENATPIEVTELNPSVAGSSGEMISSASDVSRFFNALVGGRLLHPAELRAMMTTRPTGGSAGRAYGLGLESRQLPCGGVYWGHGGDMLGFETATGATTDGRQATVMVNLDPGGSDAQDDDIQTALRTALCTPNAR
ncbi:MAG: serine hydrolase domain-containing protein [Actinoallomurus sp.]